MHEDLKQLHDTQQLRKLNLEKIELNRPCICIYHCDKKPYRATITEVNYFEENAKVLYVDFGNTDYVQFDKYENYLSLT